MNGFIDPVKNAKVIGQLMIAGTIINLLGGGISGIFEGGLTFRTIMYLLGSIILPLVAGMGLIIRKLWAFYVLLIIVLIWFIIYIINVINTGNNITNA